MQSSLSVEMDQLSLSSGDAGNIQLMGPICAAETAHIPAQHLVRVLMKHEVGTQLQPPHGLLCRSTILLSFQICNISSFVLPVSVTICHHLSLNLQTMLDREVFPTDLLHAASQQHHWTPTAT